MRKITALKVGRGRGKQVNVFLDGKFAFSLEAELAAKQGLQVEQVISTEQIGALARSDRFHRCLNTALRLLAYRPRSEAELMARLRQRGFDGDTQEAVVARLRELKFVDDVAFAQFWKDNRESFSPRSQRLTRLELRRKGLDSQAIDQVVDTIDDNDSAYRAAVKKARTLPRSDYQDFRRRLGEYLKRRGFDYEIINHTVERLWQEQGIEILGGQA